MLWTLTLLVICLAPAWSATLDDVRARGQLNCGVSRDLVAISAQDAQGNWGGIGADFCRAVAAAVFGDAAKVSFVPLSSKERFQALQTGKIDLLSGAPWTIRNETALGLAYAGVIYYEGQGLMVRRSLDVQSALELSGTEVCIAAGTEAALNISDFFRSHGMPYKILTFEKPEDALNAYEARRCDVYSAEVSSLTLQRQGLTSPGDHVILPEPIAKVPLAPVAGGADPQWLSIVRWTMFALIDAEDQGISRNNAASLAESDPAPPVKRLLGMEGDFGKPMGLAKDWAFQAIMAVGNYGEIYERNLGAQSGLNIERGENALWNRGGTLFAPPIR
ncbi:MAG: amino acid ABC transporter substrate-binding protein [Rhodomicrobium sp.]